MNEDEIERELGSIPLGARATVAGVEVERASLFGYRIGPDVLEDWQVVLANGSDDRAPRRQEKLLAGAEETTARLEALRREHGSSLRVTGQSKARRARWTGQPAWLVASYPALAGSGLGGAKVGQVDNQVDGARTC